MQIPFLGKSEVSSQDSTNEKESRLKQNLKTAALTGAAAVSLAQGSGLGAGLGKDARDHIVDKVLEKIFISVLPNHKPYHHHRPKSDEIKTKDIPGLSIPLLATNFRKLSSRSFLLTKVQSGLVRVMSWKQPSLTISVLLVYTFFCLYPWLLVGVPILSLLITVMVPGYDHRHPINPDLLPVKYSSRRHDDVDQELVIQAQNSSPERDILLSLRELQSSLGDLVKALESVDEFVYGVGSFVDESYSTAIYLLLLMAMITSVYLASFIPVNVSLISAGWGVILLSHPDLKSAAHKAREDYIVEHEEDLALMIADFEQDQIIIDERPEQRQVEIFELHKQGLTPRQWDPWVFTPLVFDTSDPMRISQNRPPGSHYIEDIEAPPDWYFDDDLPWTVDLSTKTWVSARAIRVSNVLSDFVPSNKNVELDPENHWAYDYEKGERGEWRRRRWTRPCFRKAARPLQPPDSAL